MMTRAQHKAIVHRNFLERVGDGEMMNVTKLPRNTLGIQVFDKYKHIIAGSSNASYDDFREMFAAFYNGKRK